MQVFIRSLYNSSRFPTLIFLIKIRLDADGR